MDCMRVAELPIDEDKAISLYREAISVFEQMNDSPDKKERIDFCKKQISLILG